MKKEIILSWIIVVLVAFHPINVARSLELNLDDKIKSFFGSSSSDKPVTNNDGLMTAEEIKEKQRQEAEDKKKKEREGVLSKASACEADGFKSCYMGAPWGSSVDEICSDDELIKLSDTLGEGEIGSDTFANANFRQNNQCDSYIASNLPKRNESCVYNNCSLEFSKGSPRSPITSCLAITVDKKLVGFYKLWPVDHKDEVTEDQFYFILSKLKDKYGKDVEKSKCNDLETYSWKNTLGGLDILLFKKVSEDQKKKFFKVSKNPDDLKKIEIFLRYIHKGTFLDLATKQKENISQDQKNLEQEKEKKLESIGSGL